MKNQSPKIERLCVIGVGLIGGSMARALKSADAVGSVVGVGRNEARLLKAQQLGVIDHYTLDIAEGARGADLVVVATPVGGMAEVFAAAAQGLTEHSVITDVGSTKVDVISAARTNLAGAFSRFVPAHPIAGGEQCGVEASREDLFQDRRVVLTPVADTEPDALARVQALWRGLGAHTIELDPAEHDRLLAATSHLPHLLAYSLVHFLIEHESSERLFQLAAGGFYDFSRIASSDPIMWRDICIANRDEIVNAIRAYRGDLDALLDLIEGADAQALEELFRSAKTARDTAQGRWSDR